MHQTSTMQTSEPAMSHLVLELHAGEAMIVNGASLRFRTRSRVELTTQARFLFGKQIMAPEAADSPARRIYFALQTAYIGADDERAPGVAQARTAIREFQAATTSGLARDILDRTLALVEADECYDALKLARRIIRHEDGVLGRGPVPVRGAAGSAAMAAA
jgi:flagellar protein FlbT